MTLVKRRIVIALGTGLVIFIAPIIWSAMATHGYYENGRCLCGFSGCLYFNDNTLYQSTPEHGYPDRPLYSLRPVADGWEATRIVPPSNPMVFMEFNSTSGAGKPGHLRLQGGDLYESWQGGTTWTRHARIYNVWSVWLTPLWAQIMRRPPDEKKAQHISCVNNLKQLGLAFRIWAGDNQDQYPFNLSTNAGGTREFCAVGKDGFDANSFLHFQIMSNELLVPLLLVCPQDRSKHAVTNWANLSPANVTYRLRSGTNTVEANPQAILAVCPVDGNILYCDGTVLGKNEKFPVKYEPIIFNTMTSAPPSNEKSSKADEPLIVLPEKARHDQQYH
jgi:hypothetical protein